MSFFNSVFLAGLGLGALVFAQDQNVNFNQVVTMNGDMQLNRIIFPDNTKIEAFSQTQRQLIVNQNPQPLSANHVIGSTGQPFVQLSQNSVSIATNGAQDLVGAQIELPINQGTLDQNGVTADNTFVAMLSPDRQAWMVMEPLKSVNSSDNTVRLVKMNAIDGEYMAIGRKTTETSNSLTPFGRSTQQSVNITGSGIQEVEFTDGFRLSVKSTQPMTINTDVVNGVSTSMLTNGAMTVNNYRYLVRTNLASVLPNLNNMMAIVQLPLNPSRVQQMAMRMGAGPNDSINLGVSQRGVLQNPGGATSGSLSPQRRQDQTQDPSQTTQDSNQTQSQPTQDPNQSQSQPSNTNPNNPAATALLLAPTFTPLAAKPVLDSVNGRVAVAASQLDGEFIVTMSIAAQGQAPAGAGQAPQAQAQAEPAPSVAGTNSSVPSASVPRRAKRQSKPSSNGQGGTVTITMAQLNVLVQRSKNGGYIPVGAMMAEFMQQMSQSTSDSTGGQILATAPVRRRAVPLMV